MEVMSLLRLANHNLNEKCWLVKETRLLRNRTVVFRKLWRSKLSLKRKDELMTFQKWGKRRDSQRFDLVGWACRPGAFCVPTESRARGRDPRSASRVAEVLETRRFSDSVVPDVRA